MDDILYQRKSVSHFKSIQNVVISTTRASSHSHDSWRRPGCSATHKQTSISVPHAHRGGGLQVFGILRNACIMSSLRSATSAVASSYARHHHSLAAAGGGGGVPMRIDLDALVFCCCVNSAPHLPCHLFKRGIALNMQTSCARRRRCAPQYRLYREERVQRARVAWV